MKGLCLFLGLTGLAYAVVLIFVALFTGVKIMQGIILMSIFSFTLISLSLTLQVKTRLCQTAGNTLRNLFKHSFL